MCDESTFHGSGVARGYDFYRLRSDDHLLQYCHDAAGAWQYGLDGSAVDFRQLARTLSLPTAVADVYCGEWLVYGHFAKIRQRSVW